MTTEQPEALRLAEADEKLCGILRCESQVGKELRRLHEENTRLHSVNAELVWALQANHQWHLVHDEHDGYSESDLACVNHAALSNAKAIGAPEKLPDGVYYAESIDGKQHDTGRVYISRPGKPGGANYFADTSSPYDARAIANAMNAASRLQATGAADHQKAPSVAEAKHIEATWLTDTTKTPERQFCEWLNSNRSCIVSEVFHEIMQRFAAHGAKA